MYKLTALFLCAFFCLTLASDDKNFQPIGSPILAEDADEVIKYWTPERMAKAIPLDFEKDFNVSEVLSRFQKDPTAVPGQVEGQRPSSGKTSTEYVNLTAPLYPCTFHENPVAPYAPYPYQSYPWITVGKIFFVQGGVSYVCSGASVNTYGIITAGHCVYSLSLGQWSSNFIFVPAYEGGVAPYGSFAAYQMWVLTSYITTGSECYDYAFVATCSYSGYPVGSWVGWLGVAWNYGVGQNWMSLGYPQAAPFDGNWNYWSVGTLCDQDSSCTQGIGSRTTGGASGGPWVIGFGTSNYVNSVNAYKYISPAQPNEIYGPYFDANVYTVYQAAFPGSAPGC